MTMTEKEAFEAMLGHHRSLEQGVARRVGALRQAAPDGDRWGSAAGDLVAFLAEEVLPHALAEEHSIYQAAKASSPELDAVVAGMVDEHRRLAVSVERLATAEAASEALRQAEAIESVFSAHVKKENDLILPLLASDPDVDLAGLLVQMHRLTEAAAQEPAVGDFTSADTESVLVALLTEAASDLADAGQGDRACRLAASAWAVLRTPRPDLAVRLTAALHRLVRSVSSEPVIFTPGARWNGQGCAEADLDVRPLAPAQRHEKIFAAYGALAPGSGFVLVNDHDPKPLRYQFEAEHPDEHTWDVLEDGPQVWRVRIGRPAGGAADGDPELDVRRFRHGQRHDVIFTTYSSLAPGGGFVLVNDHDPKPLRYQFEAQHAGEFSWDYLESGPDIWRVRIGRVPVEAGR